jgi:hypothetical protein
MLLMKKQVFGSSFISIALHSDIQQEREALLACFLYTPDGMKITFQQFPWNYTCFYHVPAGQFCTQSMIIAQIGVDGVSIRSLNPSRFALETRHSRHTKAIMSFFSSHSRKL